MTANGIATPMPILAPDDRPEDAFAVLEAEELVTGEVAVLHDATVVLTLQSERSDEAYATVMAAAYTL